MDANVPLQARLGEGVQGGHTAHAAVAGVGPGAGAGVRAGAARAAGPVGWVGGMEAELLMPAVQGVPGLQGVRPGNLSLSALGDLASALKLVAKALVVILVKIFVGLPPLL